VKSRKTWKDELRWDPDIDATDVAVAVHNGVVALTGFVRSYMQKNTGGARREARRGDLGCCGRHRGAIALHQQAAGSRDRARDAVQKLQNELPYSSQYIKVTARTVG